jgi:LuxR family transcriptional regulator, maltose regulon positive regulatory protein
MLDTARRKRVVWIVAPAGAGKTSLVTSYLAERRLPALWYNVDARDADVANLFHYLTVAATTAIRRQELRLPTFAIEHQAGVVAFARGFFEELYRGLPTPSAIVLDDYHDARSEHLDEVVRQAVATQPKRISLIIVSRAEPPPLFARAVVSGDIARIGTDELRLSIGDTAGLIRTYRPELTASRLKSVLPRVVELTNGWAAALTLLLQSRGNLFLDPVGVEQFSERLFDYFATEILDKAEPIQREFLLKTSVVPSLTPGVAEHLTGQPEAGKLLSELERRSFLTQRLGTSATYRYHPLLRTFLLKRAQADLGPGALLELHRRAAEALIQLDQIDEAMDQFETAGEVTLRTKLILSVAPSYVSNGHGRTIEAWIGRLPAGWVADHGWLLYWQAVSCMGYADARPVALLERAYAHFAREKDVAGLYMSCAAVMQTIFHEGRDYRAFGPWIERIEGMEESGLSCPPPFEPMVALGMTLASGMSLMDALHHRKWRERAVALADASPDNGHGVLTRGYSAFYGAIFIDYFDAATTVQMLRRAAGAAESSAFTKLTFMLAESFCLFVSGDNRECLALVREAVALAARTGVFAWNYFLHGVGVAAALSLNDAATAREFIDLLAKKARESGGWQEGFYYFNAGWEALTRGEGALALAFAEKHLLSAETVGPPFGRIVGPFAVALALLQLGKKREALESLEKAAEVSRKMLCAFVLHACLLVESDCLWEEDRARALASLRRGFELARAHGYHNMYWLPSELTARLAARALEHEIEPDHVRITIARRHLAPDSSALHLDNWPWPYRLRALGAFEVESNVEPATGADRRETIPGRPLTLTGKPRELLQALIAFGGRAVRESLLSDTLWPDAEGDSARRVFDTTLHRLRRQLGSEGIVRLTDGCLYLDERVCWLDVWAFARTSTLANQQIAAGVSAAELSQLGCRLFAIYRGSLLSDVGLSHWAAVPRRKMKSDFLRIVDRLGRTMEQQRAQREAARLYEGALRSEPDTQPLQAALARCTDSAARHDDSEARR